MGFTIASLVKAPEVNPISFKAKSIPVFNPINVYGRVFFFAWFGFFIAFWSWYAFPPLLSDIIAKDVHMTPTDVKNSNIVSLCATLLVRLIAGPACDRFGARKVFATTLLLGAIPTFCAGGATNVAGIMAIRFFVGILGGSFVPCQVWTTGFYDKGVVGTANALTAGLGNAGGGITYFVMPAVYNSLVRNQHERSHVAWRVSFIVPGILIVVTAVALLFTCPDTPTGKWSERAAVVGEQLRRHSIDGTAAVPGELSAKPQTSPPESTDDIEEKKDAKATAADTEHSPAPAPLAPTDTARGAVIQRPTLRATLPVLANPATLVPALCYLCSFGSELSINSILGNYYTTQHAGPHKPSVQDAGNWAAMFGLLNVVCRPLGGLLADMAFRRAGPWGVKAVLHTYGALAGVFLIVIGQLNSHKDETLHGLIGALAIFIEGANGACFGLVPLVFPEANGVVSGVTGASGNLGGIFFSLVFRFVSMSEAFWIIGVIAIVINVVVAVVPPLPRKWLGKS